MKDAAQTADLRRHVRLAVNLKARRLITPDTWAEERVTNLSSGGLALSTRTRLPPGQLEQLTITAADGDFELTVLAEVIRVHVSDEPGLYVAGLRFTVRDAASAARIEDLILRTLTAKSGKRVGPRLEVRHEVFWSSGGYAGAAQFELLNISATGAQLRGPSLPPPHALGLLSLRADGSDELLAVPAQVVWRRTDTNLAGVRFASDVTATQLVRRILQRLLFHSPVPVASLPSASLGTRIGEYELGPLLLRGHAVEIFRATGPLGPVALRRFCGNPAEIAAWTERFVAAAQLGQRLGGHPGVVQVYGAIADAEECWLATEWVEGTSLEQRLIDASRAGKLLNVEDVLVIGQEVLSTLEDCHAYLLDDEGAAQTVLHGDLRPSNVLFGPDGRARLTGFGAPFEVKSERLAWLPPEVLGGGVVTPQSDVYQAGVLLYEALAGVLPFRAESVKQLQRAISTGPMPLRKLNPAVPSAIEALVRASLAADPRARPHSAGAFAEALSHVDLSSAVTAPVIGAEPVTQLLPVFKGPPPTTAQAEAVTAPVPVVPPASRPSGPRRPLTRPPPITNKVRIDGIGPGARIGRYTVVDKLAEGGMAELFLARAENTPWPVVLKTILPSRARDREVVSLFMNEARLVSQIDHANVVRITDVGFDRESPFIAMEYFASRTLADVMIALGRRDQKMPLSLAAYVLGECCAGLESAHTLRDGAGKPLHIVHRDVTAKNILLGYGGRVKLVDFGIARAVNMQRLTMPGTIRGTAAWVAPEQISGGAVTAATDVWALGVNFYLMLTGKLPFKGDTDVQLLNQVLGTEPIGARRLRAEVPVEMSDILPRALAKSPVERYPSANDLRQDALQFAPESAVGANELSALMDALFPPERDAERMRVAKLAPEESGAMPENAPSPLKRLFGWLRK